MKIAILSNSPNEAAWNRLIRPEHTWFSTSHYESNMEVDLLVLANFKEEAASSLTQVLPPHLPVLCHSLWQEVRSEPWKKYGSNHHWMGANLHPAFLLDDGLEISLPFDTENKQLELLRTVFEVPLIVCEDRVGMVSARILFMIINEAFYTLEEGTAEFQDIDLAMRNGTEYPRGPFEWCDVIGISEVYNGLKQLQEITGDPRYKPCGLLRLFAREGKKFY